MPGVILEVFVQPGDQVKYGQRLCTLEAMKMKNAIRSPRDGVVATVEANSGETVAHGQILFTWES
jgi:biotin carboxyl carrier protein